MSKNQDPGTANTKIASSVCLSPIIRNGIQISINTFDKRNIALAGSLG